METSVATNIDEYGVWTEKMWFSNPTNEPLDERNITIMSLGLAGEVGEVMEILKKRVRDNTFDEKNFIKELGDVVYYWARIAKAFGLEPSAILQANINKLEDRKARGTMRGSGNDR